MLTGIFLLSSMIIIAINRSRLGISYAYSPRYTIYPDFLLAVIYAVLLMHIPQKYKFYFFFLIFASAVSINVKNFKEVNKGFSLPGDGLVEKNHQESNSQFLFPFQELAKDRLERSNKLGIFISPYKE
jgi:hypothetical protein